MYSEREKHFFEREEWVGGDRRPYKQLCPSCLKSRQTNSFDLKECPQCKVQMVALGYIWRVPRHGVSLRKWMKFVQKAKLYYQYNREWGAKY